MPMKTSLYAQSSKELSRMQQQRPQLMTPVPKALMFQQNLGGQRNHAINIDVQISSSADNNRRIGYTTKKNCSLGLYKRGS